MGFQTPRPVVRPKPGPCEVQREESTGLGAVRARRRGHSAPWVSGTLAFWLWIIFDLISSISGRLECIKKMESGKGLQDCCRLLVSSMFLMEIIEIIISVHFRAKVR